MKSWYSVILIVIIMMSPVQAGKLNCHLHVPVDLNELSEESAKKFVDLPAIIPDLGKPEECERENARILGSKGRCHCSFAGAGSGIGIGSEFRQYKPADASVEDGRPDWLQ